MHVCIHTHTHTHTLRLFLCIGYCALQKTVQISFQDSNFVSLGYVPRSGIAGSYGSSILISWDASTFLQQLDVPVSTQDKYIHLAMWILQKQLFKKRICLTRLRFLRARTMSFMFHVLSVLGTMLAVRATIYALILGIISSSAPIPSMWPCSGSPSWARTPCYSWLHYWWGPVQN